MNKSPLPTGLRLFTKNGRSRGNAIIISSKHHPQFGFIHEVETDFGNKCVLTASEIQSAYHTTDRDCLESICDPAKWHADKERLAFERMFPDPLVTIETAVPCHEAIRALLGAHELLLEENPYTYFELAYTRQTKWMAWICTNAREQDPYRKVLAKGQGSTPDEACKSALDSMKPTPATPAS
jgi:hypothetical protein